MFKDLYMFDFESVQRHLQHSRSQIIRFLDLCKVRVQQQTRAAEDSRRYLQKVRKDDSSTSKPMTSSLCAAESMLHARDRESRDYINQLEQEVLVPGERLLKQHDTLVTNSMRDGTQLVRQLGTLYKKHDAILQNCRDQYEQLLASVRDSSRSKQAGELLPSERMSSLLETLDYCNEYTKLHNEYIDTIDEANLYWETSYTESMGTILNMLEEVDKTWMDFVNQGCLKLFLFELSLGRNLQYENEKVFTELEKGCGSDGDMIERGLTQKIISNRVLQPVDITNSPIVVFPDIIGPPSVDSVSSITELLTATVFSDPTSPTTPFRDIFQSFTGRQKFCVALESCPPGLPSMHALETLGKILNAFLDECVVAYNEVDAESVMRICGMASLFFAITKDGKKKFIQSQIYHHGVWNRVGYWEDCLRILIAEETLEGAVKGYLDTASKKKINIDTFGTYLLMFGLTSASAVDICKRVVEQCCSDDGRIFNRLMESVRTAKERQERNVSRLVMN